MKIIIAAATLCCATQAAAQQLSKCADAAGKITYASQSCELLGLKPAGEIRERATVAPAFKAPPAPAAAKPAPTPAAKAATGQAAKKDAEKEEHDRRCFKTAKGTRCNDTPDEKSK
jgi:hypothetical protein